MSRKQNYFKWVEHLETNYLPKLEIFNRQIIFRIFFKANLFALLQGTERHCLDKP
jgi:hypothetical protein